MAKKNKNNRPSPQQPEVKKTPWQLAQEAYEELKKLSPDTVDYYNKRADYDEMVTNLHAANKLPQDFDYQGHMVESMKICFENTFNNEIGKAVSPELLTAQKNYAFDVQSCIDKTEQEVGAAIKGAAKTDVQTKIAQDMKSMYDGATQGNEIDMRKFAVSAMLTMDMEKSLVSQEDAWKLIAEQYSGMDDKLKDFVSPIQAFQDAYNQGNQLTQEGLVNFIVNRDELRDAVLSDHETVAALDEALNKQELSLAEKDKIMAWATCEDPEKSKELFADLVNGVNKIEVKGTNEEQQRAWKSIRDKAMADLNDLRKAEHAAKADLDRSKKAIADHEKKIEQLDKLYPDMPQSVRDKMKEQMKGSSVYQDAQKELEDRYKAARMASAKLQVQNMVCAHAKSEYEQARAAVKLDAAEQRRKNLEKHFEGIGKEAREIGKSISREWNTVRACQKANWKVAVHDLNFARDIRDAFRVSRVKVAFKHLNETRKDIDKQEQKLLKAANKLAKKEYKRDHRFDFGKAWGRGNSEGPKQFSKDDMKAALKYLEGHDGLYINHLKKGLEDLRKQEEKDVSYFDKRVNLLERSIFEERQFIQELGDPLLQMQENHELGGGLFANMATQGLNGQLNAMLEDTQINFDADLAQMLNDTGHGHINKGQGFEFKDMKGDHDGPGIGDDGPEIGDDGPEIGG